MTWNRTFIITLYSLGLIAIASAANSKKKPPPMEQVLTDLDTLHQADAECLVQIKADEFRKIQRSVLVSQHQALPPVAQEPQHRSLEQRHDVFINKYTNRVDIMRTQLQAHADVEKAIRTKEMKLVDAVASLKKWKSESDAMESTLKSFGDEFVQIGQDYLDIFQDHNSPAPSQANQLINPSDASH
jgi:hypothetical protein